MLNTEHVQILKNLLNERKNNSKDEVFEVLNQNKETIKEYLKLKVSIKDLTADLNKATGLKITDKKLREFLKKNRLIRTAKKSTTTRLQQETIIKCPKCNGILSRVRSKTTNNVYYRCTNQDCKCAFKMNEDGSPGDQFV